VAGLSLAVDEDTDMVTKCVSRTRWSKFHKPVSLCSWAVTVAGLPSAVYEETNMVIRIHTYLELDLFSKASPASTKATQKASWNQPGVEPVTGSQWISSSLYSGSGTNRKVSELMVQIKQKSVYGVETLSPRISLGGLVVSEKASPTMYPSHSYDTFVYNMSQM